MGGSGKMNHFRAVCRTTRHRAVHKLKQDEVQLDKYTEEDGQIDMLNINFIKSNTKSPGLIAKLKTSSYQNIVKISYKVDIGSNSNILPFHIYKILFPRMTKKALAKSQK